MRRAEPGKTGHQVKALARVGARGEIAGFGRSRDHAEPIAQPLHRRTGDKDAAFEGIGGAAVESIGDRRQQTVMGAGRRAADVDERKGAGAVSRFDHAGRKAALSDQRRLLIAGHRRDRDRGAEQFGRGRAKMSAGIEHFGQDRLRDVEGVEKLVVPGETADVEQHRPRGVGRVSRMPPAAGQPP